VPVVAIIPVTELLNPAKASRRPTEQRANPIKRRELKKAAREVEFVFMDVLFFLF
jgi:prolyl-tRNA editing enzyme YbaK/EbsC (Cys-tRNA(Pro) deacylase)